MSSFTRLRLDTRNLTRTLGNARMAIVVAALGIALSIAAFLWLRFREHAGSQREFSRRAQSLSILIQRGFEHPLEAVRTIPEFFAASDQVTREEFISFVSPILRRHPSVSYIEWAPVVSDADRDLFERHARETEWPDFAIKEPSSTGQLITAPRRPDYMPLIHAVSLDRVRPIIGLDIGFSDDRRARNQRALMQNSIDISPRFALVEDPPHVGSIAILIPAQLRDRQQADPRVPRRGLAVLIFRLEQTIRNALPAGVLDQMDLVVIDQSATTADERLLFESRANIGSREGGDSEREWRDEFHFLSRQWAIRFIPRQSPAFSTLSLVVLGLGIAISLALGFATSLVGTVRRLRTQALVAKQLGQYKLTRKLGEGGMGVVFAAEHAFLRRPTAIKVLSDRSLGSESLARFEREVQMMSLMTHPNTVSIYDFGHSADGVFYYAMEFIDGMTIEQLVRDAGPLPPARVVYLLRQVCGSLREAHAMGLVHRDIKPSNIMVCERGGMPDFVKVLDFGLVKQVSELTEGKVSGAGRVLGTPQYMPPEALLREGPTEPTVDVYALGCVAYYMLTATEVFRAETVAAVVAHHLNETPELPSKRRGEPIPEALEQLVMQCLAKQSSQRPQSMAALSSALEQSAGAAQWTEADADSYWRQARARRSTRSETPTLTEAGDTLSIDLKARQARTH